MAQVTALIVATSATGSKVDIQFTSGQYSKTVRYHRAEFSNELDINESIRSLEAIIRHEIKKAANAKGSALTNQEIRQVIESGVFYL